MKRLIIVCEGPTENEFCMKILAPVFLKHGIYIYAPLIKKSNGGIVSWDNVKRQILMHLHENNSTVSLFIDFYGIKDSYLFPGWEESKSISSKTDRLSFLCNKMKEDIPSELVSRFIPYMQMHEFESLLFSDIEVFRNNFDDSELNYSVLERAVNEFPNPEEINSRPTLAPSKRLIEAVQGYEKVVYGNCIAEEIGLERMRKKCPLFNQWVSHLLTI